MRKQAWAFLLVGFAVGFGALYTWTKKQAPEMVRAMPLPLEHAVGPGSSSSARSSEELPPLDTARIAELERETTSNPKNVEALVELGNLHFEQRNFKEAIGFYAKALDLRPSNVGVRTDLATAMFYENRFDDSIAEFRRSLELAPSDPRTLFNLGVALLHGKNDPEGAIQSWERLVQSNPGFDQADFVKEQIRLLRERLKQP
jgi:cytochrome c-type biogenesis protein CcmH/NrfG